jgi:uncharacterized protein (TIGR03067 family)
MFTRSIPCATILLTQSTLLSSLVFSAEAEENALNREIHGLVEQLDHESFNVREAAERQLLKLGPKAGSELTSAVDSASPEAVYRIRRILSRLDRVELVGNWQLIRWERGGKSKTGFENTIYIRHDEWRAKQWRFEYRTNPRTKPKQIDWRIGSRMQHGIYKIENEKLFLCVSKLDDPGRPTEFRTREGDGFSLHVRQSVVAKSP